MNRSKTQKQGNKKANKEQIINQTETYYLLYYVICCDCKTIENMEMYINDFLQHGYHESMFIAPYLYSFYKLINKCYKCITTRSISGKPQNLRG